ncbi:hypothetical protein GOBAR_AA29788 [Gossypium barbadense]|uniref:Uncharacterized protein n=1 Tax=Gossypium barbadense TaxID=3634 RepID=A0A2P5WIJ6_GOSBA|nr:hypothetical protein GOBAR_AA29788 [Gossypium barbadense]
MKSSYDELNTSPNQLKVGDKVLLDAADPLIATSEPNEEISLTVLNIFPYGTVEVIHPKFGTFKFFTSNLLTESSNTRFSHPHGQAHRRALGYAHITGGDTAVRYGCLKTGQNFSPTWYPISCHDRATWPWEKLPKQHWRETRPCLETVVETENLTLACNTPISFTRGRHFQTNTYVDLYTRAWEK